MAGALGIRKSGRMGDLQNFDYVVKMTLQQTKGQNIQVCGEAGILRCLFAYVIDMQAITLTIKDLTGNYSFIFFCLFLSVFSFFSHRWAQNSHKAECTMIVYQLMPEVGASA